MLTDTRPDGKIKKLRDGSIEVSIVGESGASNFDGVVCKNPNAPEEKRIYSKQFFNKKIYLPDEYNNMISENFHGNNNFIISLNGYSKITAEQSLRYGIREGDYEEACRALGRSMTAHLKSKFKGANLSFIYGASDMGVDRAIEDVAKEFGLPLVGFSCPRYMLYTKDDNVPVYVAPNGDAYSDSYIKTLDLLVATGGRAQALTHDVLAACVYNKRIHFIDVLNSLSSTGGVPATIIDKDGKRKIDNAAAAMGRNISFFNRFDAVASSPVNGDLWDAIFYNVNSIATETCRQKMPPEYKFTNV